MELDRQSRPTRVQISNSTALAEIRAHCLPEAKFSTKGTVKGNHVPMIQHHWRSRLRREGVKEEVGEREREKGGEIGRDRERDRHEIEVETDRER